MRIARHLFYALVYMLTILPMSYLFAQRVNDRTIGLIKNNSQAFDGFTLFSPHASTRAFLINNCGEVMNSWQSEYRPGNAVYLTPEGDLYRAGQVPNLKIHAGGAGGVIEKYNWSGDLSWQFFYNSPTVRAHHDFQVLPNGNVLILAWELYDSLSSIEKGRKPELLPQGSLWPEHVIEVQPIGQDSAHIVWSWHAWDHLVQDYDSTKVNYGSVSEHPGKIDINYVKQGREGADWHHANSIAYNAELDQIMISVLFFDEVWVIDHNTTTEEAKGEKGDLLYRWGNPQTYQKGTAADQHLFGQHNAYWIPDGLPDAGKVMIFNNGAGRPDSLYTTVVKIVPEWNGEIYETNAQGQFFPNGFDYEYRQNPPTNFYSRFVSGAQQLPNGNILVTDGAHGTLFEINAQEQIVWKYVNPLTIFGLAEQGDEPVNPGGEGTNVVFRATKYPTSYQGFVAREFTSSGTIEAGDVGPCTVLSAGATEDFRLFPNPASDLLRLENYRGSFTLFDIHGKRLSYGMSQGLVQINVSPFPSGLYILELNNNLRKKIIIKH